jgi:uncharacterized membrane protein YccC
MSLSRTTKESFKTALAMTLAYGIALSMDWDNPLWAGFAVIFVSLSTSGQSFNKSAMRMFGAVVAGAAALTLIALFPQDRWLFMLALSVYVGFCTYMMGGAKYQYFWFSSGYVCIIVALQAGPDPVNAFGLTVLRVQETALGILVYAVVAALLWRTSSVGSFKSSVADLQSIQHQLYRSYFSLMNGSGDPDKAKALHSQEIQQLAQFKTLLLAADTDSYEIRGMRQQWRRHQSQLFELSTVMERWHDSFTTVETLDYQRLMLNLTDFDHELEQRFADILRMLDGNAPEHRPQAIELQLSTHALDKLSPFQKSALLALQTNLLQLERLTRSLLMNTTEIKGFNQGGVAPMHVMHWTAGGSAFDIERLASVLQVMASLWLAYLLYIYVYDIPGGIGVVIFSGVLAMPIATNSTMHASSMVMPFMGSILLCGILYAVVMPQLSSFIGLGTMIFVVTFIICYIFSSPKKILARASALSIFVTITGIDNQQTYNILSIFDTALMFALMFVVLFITAYMPFSPRPEQEFMRLLSRFFRTSEHLMATLSGGQLRPGSLWERRREDFHLQDLKTLPNKIKIWSQLIDTDVLSGISKQQVEVIIPHLQMINIRLQVLLEARGSPQAQVLIDELHAESLVWHATIQEAFQQLSRRHIFENPEAFRMKLAEMTGHLELRIKAILDTVEKDQLSRVDKVNFYRLLGAFRGLSDALLGYSESARLIDWPELRKVRFSYQTE